ncbi:MAG: hypothetical protein AAGF26_10535 [Cyanobacteria bacterium P01_G01_bin.49]
MTVEIFDPRVLANPVYKKLYKLREDYDTNLKNGVITKDQYDSRLKEQKKQAIELYTYLSTWGLMRLKAEELALNKENIQKTSDNIKDRVKVSQYGKLEVVQEFFNSLQGLMPNSQDKLELKKISKMDVDEYLGLTGLALALAQEFSFWGNAIYYDIKEKEGD